MEDSKPDTIPAPVLHRSTLAHLSERMLAMGEEFRQFAEALGDFGGVVDQHEKRLERAESRLRKLERSVNIEEHPTIPEG